MDNEKLEKELEDLVGMLRDLNRITDRNRRKWLKLEIRRLLNRLMRD